MPDPTAEQIGREAGEAIANAIADNLERVILRLVEEIATLKVEQAELRDALLALDKREHGHYYELCDHVRETREAFPDRFA